jgi:hypothetical protein
MAQKTKEKNMANTAISMVTNMVITTAAITQTTTNKSHISLGKHFQQDFSKRK